jgi:DNA-binding NtrC family response regulator
MPEAVEAIERHMILRALQATRWNKTHAAARLGVSRRNLIRKVERMALSALRPPDLPPDADTDADADDS